MAGGIFLVVEWNWHVQKTTQLSSLYNIVSFHFVQNFEDTKSYEVTHLGPVV